MGKVNFMHARNKITIIILSLVVTGAIFGSLITVRDFDRLFQAYGLLLIKFRLKEEIRRNIQM